MIQEKHISDIPGHIDLSRMGPRFQEIKLDCQSAWDSVLLASEDAHCLALSYARGKEGILKQIWPFEDAFPYGKSWSKGHVGDEDELDKVLNGGWSTFKYTVGQLSGMKQACKALNVLLADPDIKDRELKSTFKLILNYQASLWDRLNQAGYLAQRLHSTAGVYQPIQWS